MNKINILIVFLLLQSLLVSAQPDLKLWHRNFTEDGDSIKYLTHKQDKKTYLLAEKEENLNPNIKAFRAQYLDYSEDKWNEILDKNQQLEVLYIDKDVQLPQNIVNLKNLKYLFMISGKLKYLPTNLDKLKNLKVLYITLLDTDDTKLSSLESIFKLTNLEELSLNHCQLGSLSENIGQLNNLKYLDLGKNFLVSLPQNFGSLKKLEVLNLNENALTVIPQTICMLQKLKNLDLKDNAIANLSTCFGDLYDLETLDLSINYLTSLPSSIGKLSNLNTLNLSNNNLDSLTINLKNLKNLKSLLINENLLTSYHKINNIDIIFSGLENLEELHSTDLLYIPFHLLKKNKIHTLEFSTLLLKEIDWNSICNLKQLKKLILHTFDNGYTYSINHKLDRVNHLKILDKISIDSILKCQSEVEISQRESEFSSKKVFPNEHVYEVPNDEQLQVLKIAFETDKSEQNLALLANEYNTLAWNLMHFRNYKDALSYVELGIEIDKNNIHLKSNYPLALALNGQSDKAKKLYLFSKNKPFDETYPTFKDVFLDDLQTFEMTHQLSQEVAQIFESIKTWLEE